MAEQMETVTDLTKGVYRRLYSGFTKGQRINKLSLSAEAWFWRVLATVDDFGNGDADPDLCRDATAGRRKVTTRQVSEWLGEMRTVGLLQFYTVKSEPYLHVIGFEITQPAGKNGRRIRRYPSPDESEGIQDNPDVVSASYSDNDSYSDSDNDPDQQRAVGADKRGTRLPDEFCLNSEMREWASLNTPHVDLDLALAEFCDYWRGVPGQRGKKLDWLATWRNRMREQESRASRNGHGRPSKVDGSMAAVREVMEEYKHGN